MIDIDIIQANNSSHKEIDSLMIDLQKKRINNEIIDTLIFVEHPEIVTVGRRGMLDGLTAPKNFPSSQVDRGGGLTWHGPGQLVGYPIFQWKEESVRKVITTIEEWIIQSLFSIYLCLYHILPFFIPVILLYFDSFNTNLGENSYDNTFQGCKQNEGCTSNVINSSPPTHVQTFYVRFYPWDLLCITSLCSSPIEPLHSELYF